jgi:hypothetical protein
MNNELALPGFSEEDNSPLAESLRRFAAPTRPSLITIAGIGTRKPTSEQAEIVRRTARWAAERGIHIRSGGAAGCDTLWEVAAAEVDPTLVTVCQPSGRRAVAAANVIHPPYPAWTVELAVAEWLFADRLPDVGLPPYADRKTATRFRERKRWRSLETRDARDGVIPAENDSYTQRLMIRNGAIICPSLGETVHLTLGVLGESPGGGGTGHAFRLGRALGIPSFDLGTEAGRAAARDALRDLTT